MNKNLLKKMPKVAVLGIAAIALFGSIGVNALTTDATAGSTTPAPTPKPTPTPTPKPTPTPTPSDLAGLELAKSVALADAGLTEAEVTFKELETETEDGVVLYEVEFVSNGVEYEYKVSAAGVILTSEKEIDDLDDKDDSDDSREDRPRDFVDGDTQDHHAEPADDHHDQHRD